MTTPLWCLIIVTVMPLLIAGIGAYLRVQQLGELDTRHPRIQALELRGAAARALAAQQNAWEALAMFTVAVGVAHLAGAAPGTSTMASIAFVVARVVHAVAYISDFAPLRSIAFAAGFGCCIWLVVLAA